MHLATWPPRCSECGKFMPANRSVIERRDHGLPSVGPDDYEIGMCQYCEDDMRWNDKQWKHDNG